MRTASLYIIAINARSAIRQETALTHHHLAAVIVDVEDVEGVEMAGKYA
jgi:hypothetical protein